MTATIMLAALLRVDLPSHSAFLIDGGVLKVGADTYTTRDSVLGVPESFESLTEGVGDEAPSGAITFIPPDNVSSSTLNSPLITGSRVRIWVAEVDPQTGLVLGTPDPMADWIVDFPSISNGRNGRRLTLNCVTTSDAMFEINLGNSLSPAFHKRLYPGETGLDNASGVATSVAWGAASAPRGSNSSSGYGGGTQVQRIVVT
ncbi:MAG TPA: hypothetical protein VF637_15750 [Sphingomicrobium sp.]|jgi:hypothetical protein